MTFAFRSHFKKSEVRAHEESPGKTQQVPPETAAKALFGEKGSGLVFGGDFPPRFSFHLKGKLFFLKTEV